MAKGYCELCKEEVFNMGLHNYQQHKRMKQEGVVVVERPNLIVDEPTPDKLLSSLLSDMRELLRKYQSSMKVSISERGGKPYEIELVARIQV